MTPPAQLQEAGSFLAPYGKAEDAVPIFSRLFRGRTDAYALQQSDGSYRPVRQALTPEVLAKHLVGEITVGVYLVTPVADTCSMAVIDVDHRSKDMALRLGQACAKVGLKTDEVLFEASGNKGFHVWFFVTQPVRARDAMRLGMTVSGLAGLLGDVEVFPKQSHVPEGGFGNLIKLPGRHAKSGRFSRFFSSDLRPLDFSILEKIQPLTPDRLSNLSLENHVPSPSQRSDARWSEHTRNSPRTPPCIERILQGVTEGRRNICAFKLAVFLKERALPLDLTLSALNAWNIRNAPQLPLRELEAAVRRAYVRDYHGIGCQSADMAAFCNPEACPYSGKHRGAVAPLRQTPARPS
jgi:hypothetical protein